MSDSVQEIRNRYYRLQNDGTFSSARTCAQIAKDNFEYVLSVALEDHAPKKKPVTMADHYPAGQTTGEPCNYCMNASDGSEAIVSQIDTVVGMLTVPAMDNELVMRAKNILLKASIELGGLFEL